MYSQYNQYQQPAAVTTSQSGLFWDGTKWIPSSSGACATPRAHTLPMPLPSVPTITIHFYLNNIHNIIIYGKLKNKNQLELSQTLPPGSTAQQEASRQAQWAKHYSDLSSIAAHYYHSHVPGTPVPTLPPAPPGATTAAAVTQPQQQQPHVVTQQQPPQQNQNDSPDGLKRFVHKCLQQCSVTGRKRTNATTGGASDCSSDSRRNHAHDQLGCETTLVCRTEIRQQQYRQVVVLLQPLKNFARVMVGIKEWHRVRVPMDRHDQ